MTDLDHCDGGAVWGPLHRDTETVDDALGAATEALARATTAAMWLTENDYPINSPLADILAGLTTVVDGLLSQRVEQAETIGREIADDD